MKKDLIGKGYVANLDEYEDDGYALFSEKQKNNKYSYHSTPLIDLMEVFEKYIGKEIKIEITLLKKRENNQNGNN